MARKRLRWKTRQASVDPRRLVFIDVTWTKTSMGLLRGWAPRGERLRGQMPFDRWTTMTFLAALRCNRSDAPWAVDGPINAGTFRAYVEAVLVPTPGPGTSSRWTI